MPQAAILQNPARTPRARIVADLLAWYRTHGRHDLPWRRDREPYHVLVSELMLQQTQVPRVIPKYEAFLASFPTVRDLADAPRSAVLRAWQGLGYNSRAIRLHELAQRIAAADGRFPTGRDELLALPGIGPYTAGAIRIFAYDETDLSVDVNVRRVLTRLAWRPDTRPSPAAIDALALDLIRASRRPHDWHSALMDLGSTVCVARAPVCDACPLRASCKSRGARPDERRTRTSRAAAPFLGSNRWWRGRVLALLLSHPQRTARIARLVLGHAPDATQRTACKDAIASLIEDGIVRNAGGGSVALQEDR